MAPRDACGRKGESLKEGKAHEGLGLLFGVNSHLKDTDVYGDESPEMGAAMQSVGLLIAHHLNVVKT
jgi:hypothetical protein